MLRGLGRIGGLVGMGLLCTPASYAKSPETAQPPAAQPLANPKPVGTWPKTLDDAKAEKEAAESKTAPAGWAKAEIDAATSRCKAQLAGLSVITVPADPIKEGSCGTPAPVQLISIGQKPQLVFNPPATLTCDMVAALHKWVQDGIQPLARKHLGAPIAQMDVMSDYSCRAAYGRKRGRLSEHARVNALDIRSFLTTSGLSTALKDDWGLTARDVRAQVAAAEKARLKAIAAKEAEKAEAARKPAIASQYPTPRSPGVAAIDGAPNQGQPASPSGMTVVTKSSPPDLIGTLAPQDDDKPFRAFSGVFGQQQNKLPTLGLSKLGGPKDLNTKKPTSAENRALFLRGLHTHACTVFGTVLGPEANDAHRDHFHVDMAERELGSFCE